MMRNLLRGAALRRVVLASVAGILLAVPAFGVSTEVAGGGDGSAWAFYAFFAPEWLAWSWLLEKPRAAVPAMEWAVVGMFGLYAVYGGVLGYARFRRAGVWICLALLGGHYAAFAALMIGIPWADPFAGLPVTLARLSVVHSVVVVELFVALQVLALQYAQSEEPFRPHMRWPTVTALSVGLLVGVTLYVWGHRLA